jgi:hypothetical protein
MERSEQIGELIGALAKAQSEFTPALKSSDNPFFNSKYADLATNIDAIRPALNKHGIAFLQFDTSDIGRKVGIVTTSLHHGEQFISVTAEAPAEGSKGFNVQSLGACWTYLRRYTLQAICGLASEDDDGNSLADDPKKQEVLAEVKRQKRGITVEETVAQKSTIGWNERQAKIPPELDWSYNKSSGVLICRAVSVEKKAKADGKEYVVLTVNNELDKGKKPLLYYWHATHREDLMKAKGKLIKLMVVAKEKGFTVDQVMEIDGVVLKRPEETEETQARLLASTLDFEEEELREFHGKVCEGSWTRVLEALRQRKAEVDANVEVGER